MRRPPNRAPRPVSARWGRSAAASPSPGTRIVKDIVNCGDWNCQYHFYYNGQSMIETRNGFNQLLRQQVWGLAYVDELVQIGLNVSPAGGSTACNRKDVP